MNSPGVNLVVFERKIFIRKLFRVQLRELRELHELGFLGRIDENHFRTRISKELFALQCSLSSNAPLDAPP